MKLIKIHAYILLSRASNSRLLPLSEKDVLSLRSNWLGKRGCYLLGWQNIENFVPPLPVSETAVNKQLFVND